MVITKLRHLGSLTLIVLIKRTHKFVGDINAVIDDGPSKLIKSVTRDMGASEFLIKQIVHEDVQYSSYKMRNGQFLSRAIKDKRKDHAAKLFKKTQTTPPTECALLFLKWEKFRQNLSINDEKPNTQFIWWWLGWLLMIVTLCLHSSSHMVSDSKRAPTSSAWKRVATGWLYI